MGRSAGALVLALVVLPAAVRAQQQEGFTVLRGADTIAVEHYTRDTFELAGSLVRSAGRDARERVRYRITMLEDGSTPLLELSTWRAEDSEETAARQTTRVIFKDDSVAVDEANVWSGVRTFVLPTTRNPVPYLNLSVAILEQATRRASLALSMLIASTRCSAP